MNRNGAGQFFKNGTIELAKSLILLVAVSFISYQVISKYFPIYQG
jgi:hypothetical protein